ncbi:uncharacterized protein LOC142852672 [Microtus pennsylvanicus]|uniref:uncharacterized protein LOC142852672 n=1 Tax=Microtus pennsylvanicus TaxID=10058 RepID=UPI003F6CEFE7
MAFSILNIHADGLSLLQRKRGFINFPTSKQLRLLSRARPVTDQPSLRSARSSPNPRAQVDSAGPRPALSAGPTPPRPPGRSPRFPVTQAGRARGGNQPAATQGARRREKERTLDSPRGRDLGPLRKRAGIYLGESASESERRPRPLWRETIIRAGRGGGYGSSSVSSVQGTCRAGGRPAEKTNRCFFFLLLLLPHRNTHKHPSRGPSYRGGIAAGPGTNPPVGGGVPPCGWLVSEQNADRKCSCRNDSLRRRQTLTTTPSSPLHFRHRRRRRSRRRRQSGSQLGLRGIGSRGPGASVAATVTAAFLLGVLVPPWTTAAGAAACGVAPAGRRSPGARLSPA